MCFGALDLGSARDSHDYTSSTSRQPPGPAAAPTPPPRRYRTVCHRPSLTGATTIMYKQATQRTTEVLSLPPRWLGMYSDFITKNSSAVSQIESALRSLTYIIPGTV